MGDPLPIEDDDVPKPEAPPPAIERFAQVRRTDPEIPHPRVEGLEDERRPGFTDAPHAVPRVDVDERPKREAPPSGAGRAEWLVGADEGLIAELQRSGQQTPPSLPAPRLGRPEDPEAGKPRSSSSMPSPFRGAVPRPPAASGPPSQVMPSWEQGSRSVPSLPRAAAPAPAPASRATRAPEQARDFPMDDAEERARINAEMAEQQAQAAALAARPHHVVKPQEFEIPDMPLPWWAQLPQLVRFDRRVQLVLAALGLAMLVIAFWPRAEKTISVAHLKQHADRYADTPVRVGGSVGEVFAVGGSWAYTLVQGSDTIVVFTRTHQPTPREHVVVVGTLSTGYLDGQSRVAIFESTR